MASKDSKMCSDCRVNFVLSCSSYQCESCARVLCENCMQSYGSVDVIASDHNESRMEGIINIQCCKFSDGLRMEQKGSRKNCGKLHPSGSPRQSSELEPSMVSPQEKLEGYSPHTMSKSSVASISSYPSMVSFSGCPNRSDDEEEENSTSHFFSASSDYYNDASDLETNSISDRHEFYSFKSFGSSPSDSPSRIHIKVYL